MRELNFVRQHRRQHLPQGQADLSHQWNLSDQEGHLYQMDQKDQGHPERQSTMLAIQEKKLLWLDNEIKYCKKQTFS